MVAAGRGERAGEGPLPKQFRPVRGRPAVAWSIDALAAAGCSPIVVALPPDMLSMADDLLGPKGVAFVAGGATRQESVWKSLDAVSADHIVIHDAARPLVAEALIRETIRALADADAVVPVLPVDDTIKEVDADGRVVTTVDRAGLRRVQTPQAFRAAALRSAHEAATRDGFVGTDDAQLVERIGGRVVTVPGRWTNLKLTRPEDFSVAELFAQR